MESKSELKYIFYIRKRKFAKARIFNERGKSRKMKGKRRKRKKEKKNGEMEEKTLFLVSVSINHKY